MISHVVTPTDPHGPANDAPTQSTPKLLVTIREATEVLSMGRSLIFEEIRRGRIKVVKPSRITLIPVECLTEYVELLKSEAARAEAA